MSREHHNRGLRRASQIPHLDSVVSRRRCYKILILVEVHWQYFIVVSTYTLNIFVLSQIPDAHCLIATAATEYWLVRWMPDSRIACKFMHELSLLLHGRCVPHFDRHVIGTCQNGALIQMTPVDGVYFFQMCGHSLDRLCLRSADVPQLDRAVSTRTQDLVLIGLIEADIECCVWCLYLPDYRNTGLIIVQNRDSALADHAVMLTLCHCKLGAIKRTPSATKIAHIRSEKLGWELDSSCWVLLNHWLW